MLRSVRCCSEAQYRLELYQDTIDGKFYIRFPAFAVRVNYCPWCGKPLSGEE